MERGSKLINRRDVEASLSKKFIRVVDDNGNQYDLPKEIVEWMLNSIRTIAEETHQYEDEDLGLICELDLDIYEDVKLLLGELEDHLIEE